MSTWDSQMKRGRRGEDTHDFTLILDGADVTEGHNLDALFEAGCGDALFGVRGSVQHADFSRRASSFAEAVGSAIRAVESAVGNLRVIRVEPDDLVSASAIARRTDRSREGVRLLIEGKRGPGGFPSPIAWADTKTRLWQWSDVALWFSRELDEEVPDSQSVDFIAAVNAALEVRRRAPRLATDLERTQIRSYCQSA